MSTQDDFDSQTDLSDDVSSGRALPKFDSEREKLLCDWVERWREISAADQFEHLEWDDYDEAQRANDYTVKQWQLMHVKDVVALPTGYVGRTQECAIYLRPVRGTVFKPHTATWKRFKQFSDRIARRLDNKAAAHRGYTLDEIPDNYKERYLLDGVIPAGELTVIYGSPKAGKSAWGQKVAACVASKNLECDGMPVEHGRVLYVTLDPGARRFQVKQRIAAVCDRLGVPEVMDNKRIVLVDDAVYLDNDESVDHFLQQNRGKFALVVIDPLYKALTSGDPAIAGEMVRATEGMKTIIGATGAALLLVHHATKARSEMYGSTFLDAALDARLFVERVRNDVTVTVEVVKNGEAPEQPFRYRTRKRIPCTARAGLSQGSRR